MCFRFNMKTMHFISLRTQLGAEAKCQENKKHVRSCETGGAFAEVFGIVYPPREGLDRHSPGFTFLNLGVTALSEDSTEATSPAEINKD